MLFINELTPVCVYSRIRTFKDTFYKEINDACTKSGIFIEAKWLDMFSLLINKEDITVNQIAKDLGQSHTSIVQKIKELKREHLVIITTDKQDHRKKLVRLSQYGKNLALESQNSLIQLNKVTTELLDKHAPGIIEMIDKLEKSLRSKSIFKRIEEIKK